MENWLTKWKDVLDLSIKMLSLLVTVFIAWLGLDYSQASQKNARDEQKIERDFSQAEQISQETTRTVDFLSKAAQASESEKLSDQSVGLSLIQLWKDKRFLNRVSPTLANDQWFLDWATKLKDHVQSISAVPKVGEKAVSSGWVYLGQYQNNHWDTVYLDGIVNDGQNPDPASESFKGKVLRVSVLRGALNVRSGPATETALMPVIGIAKEGESIEVKEVAKVPNNPHYWAKFDTIKKQPPGK